MLNNIVAVWLSQYSAGAISRMELLSLIFSRLTKHPEDKVSVLSGLRSHPDLDVRELAAEISKLMEDQEKRHSEIRHE